MDKAQGAFLTGLALGGFVVFMATFAIRGGNEIRIANEDDAVATCNAEWEHRMVDQGHAVYIDLDGDSKGDVFHMLATEMCGGAPGDVVGLPF